MRTADCHKMKMTMIDYTVDYFHCRLSAIQKRVTFIFRLNIAYLGQFNYYFILHYFHEIAIFCGSVC